MLFIFFFGIIAALIIGLNIHDSNNISKIEEYLRSKGCDKTSYYQGKYKALCRENLIIVENGFNVDLEKAEVIDRGRIRSVKDITKAQTSNSSGKNLLEIVTSGGTKRLLAFETQEELKSFEADMKKMKN